MFAVPGIFTAFEIRELDAAAHFRKQLEQGKITVAEFDETIRNLAHHLSTPGKLVTEAQARFIENKINPGAPMDKNLYDLPPREQKKVPEVCGSLREALDNLDRDRAFLKKGGVMDDDFIDSYIELKMEEVMRLQLHPHPVEFDMYYKC